VAGCGCVDGATYSIVVSVPAGVAHGFEFSAQTCPTLALPFPIPFTVHVTFAFDVLVTVAEKSSLAPAATTADAGDTVTAIGGLFTIVTVADAFCVLATAVTVTGFAGGGTAGAV